MPTAPWLMLLGGAVPMAVAPCPACGHAPSTLFWLAIGFLGQGVFTARFLVQWLASERRRDSVMPVAFWWLSLAGGLALLIYTIHSRDPVLIVGQGLGVFIYIRNLMLVARRRAATSTPALPRPHMTAPTLAPRTPIGRD